MRRKSKARRYYSHQGVVASKFFARVCRWVVVICRDVKVVRWDVVVVRLDVVCQDLVVLCRDVVVVRQEVRSDGKPASTPATAGK